MATTKKTTKTKGAELDLVLPADALAVVNEGFNLIEFLQKLGAFFKTATELEVRANQTLATAQALVVPENKEQDAALQTFIRTARADRKVIEEHWGITSLVSRFHKSLTAKRDVGVSALKAAEELGTRNHERYVAAEKARAAAEQRRLQEIEDAKAAEDRRKTLESFEAAAIAAEEKSPDLSAREQLVVSLVHQGKGWADACRQARYVDPIAQAARLQTSEKIKAALQAVREAEAIRRQAEATKELPLPAEVIEVAPELNKGDRGTWVATVVDVELLRQAAFTDKTLGIPLDIFDVNQAALNRYARALEKRLELWPGVVVKRKTTVV